MSKRKVMLIGNFLSEHRSTIGISQKIILYYEKEYNLKIHHASSKKNKIFRAVDILKKIIQYNPSKVIVDTYSDLAFIIAVISLLASFVLRFKVVLVIRGGKFPEFYLKNKLFVNFFMKHAFQIRTPSLYIKSFLENQNYEVVYMPNPLHLERFKFTTEVLSNKSILWIRGFKKIYNPIMAVDILDKVKQNYPQATLTMIGPDGGELKNTIAHIERLKLKSFVKILGPISNDKLVEYLHSHEVFINTTSYESFGMAVMEAASAGIPIVTTSVGELPYMWEDNVEVLLSKSNEATEMAELVCKLMENKILSAKIRSSARKKTEKFDWINVRKEWEELLEFDVSL